MSLPPASTSVAPPLRGFAAWPRATLAVIALLTAFVGFGWTLNGYFTGDDFGYVGRFYEYPLAQWPRLFVESWAGNIWNFQLRELRPITALSFLIDARLWGGEALGYRVTNLLLHSACAALVGWLAWRAAGRHLFCGVVAAVLFALHPAHAEPVQWITGRVDMLATLFYLGGFGAFILWRETGRWRWGAGFVACYFGAAFGKEFGLTLPLMCLVADALWLAGGRRWREWRTWAPYGAAIVFVVGYYFCRRAAFGPSGTGAALPDLLNADFHEQFAQRQMVYFEHLFPPLERWWFKYVPGLGKDTVRTFLFVTLIALAVLALWRWALRSRPLEERRAGLFFGLGWYLVGTLPLTITYVSGRHLYLASAGVCVAVALLLLVVLRHPVVLGVATLVVAGFFVNKLRETMRPWHDAAVISGSITRELRRLTPTMESEAALLVDVHEIRQGAYVWTWAIPFVLRPPFVAEKLEGRFVVLESRGNYVDWERWHEQPAVKQLAAVTRPSWILQAHEHIPLRSVPIPPARLRAAAEKFAASALKDEPHGPWRKMIDELTAP